MITIFCDMCKKPVQNYYIVKSEYSHPHELTLGDLATDADGNHQLCLECMRKIKAFAKADSENKECDSA